MTTLETIKQLVEAGRLGSNIAIVPALTSDTSLVLKDTNARPLVVRLRAIHGGEKGSDILIVGKLTARFRAYHTLPPKVQVQIYDAVTTLTSNAALILIKDSDTNPVHWQAFRVGTFFTFPSSERALVNLLDHHLMLVRGFFVRNIKTILKINLMAPVLPEPEP